MAKIKIHFKGEEYEIDEQLLTSSVSTLKQTLTALSGGAVTPDEPETPGTPDASENLLKIEPGLYAKIGEWDFPSVFAVRKYASGDYEGASALISASWDSLEGSVFIIEDGVLYGNNEYESYHELYGEVVIPDGVTQIGKHGETASVWSVHGLVIPSSVRLIRNSEIYNMYGIFIEESSSELIIEENAFYSCNNLNYLNLPKNVRLSNNSFEGAIYLNTINFRGTKAEWEIATRGYVPVSGAGNVITVVCTDESFELIPNEQPC